MAQVHIQIEPSEGILKITGLHISFNFFCSLILIESVAGLGLLVGDAAMENLGHWVIELAENL